VQPSIFLSASIALSDVLFQAVWHHPLPCHNHQEVILSEWRLSPTRSRYCARRPHFSTGVIRTNNLVISLKMIDAKTSPSCHGSPSVRLQAATRARRVSGVDEVMLRAFRGGSLWLHAALRIPGYRRSRKPGGSFWRIVAPRVQGPSSSARSSARDSNCFAMW
jgi:hypothetical protein